MSISEMYHKAFPHYLAMGMTWEQFWEQDSSLVRDYREAERIRQEKTNYTAWLHGMYVYEALCNASPLFRAFSKSGTRAGAYPDRPHEFQRRERLTPEEENKRKMQAGMDYMAKMAAKFNQNFYRKQKAEKERKEENANVRSADAGTENQR